MVRYGPRAMNEPVRPEYESTNVSRVVPALLGKTDKSWLPAPVQDAHTVVLLVLDGLGWNEVRAQPTHFPVIASMQGGRATTVVPSTTAAVLTSITTGSSPAAHGVVGFKTPEAVTMWQEFKAIWEVSNPQSEDCCALEISMPSSSRVRSFSPCRSV